ncbi:type IV secretory system conjugative DNA transfer family protein [Psychrobacter sp.]|uniref:type IV secretory system conjugative DNA transfer family protein n=1 Tax=Psychrobacter sp. TaxID=56811 RepID=UPI0025D9E203|nr:type IV secretory system conjugative DNA transfer family protein [Psychrobacter sp.]
MNNIHLYLMLVVCAVAICGFTGTWFYNEFIKDTSPRSELRPSRRNTDSNLLRKRVNFGVVGEPLLFYGKANKRQLKNDAWRTSLPNYTASNEKRGLVVGVSGTGKTSYIYSQIVDWSKSGKSYLVTDIKPEIWGTLCANNIIKGFGYQDIVINPTDPKSLKYNFLDDVDDSELGELVKILIPAISDEAKAFAQTAQKLLRGIILHLKGRDGVVSLPSVYNYISDFKSGNKLIADIIDEGEDVPAKLMRQARLAGENERFMASAVSALLSALEFLDNSIIADNMSSSDVSLKDVLKQSNQAIFLQFEQISQTETESLYSTMVTHIIRLLMKNYREREDVFLIFDELLNGGKIDALTDKFNTMRSYKLPTFIYIQTLAGLYKKYGQDDSNNLIGACDVKVICRVNDNISAEYFSELAGTIPAQAVNIHYPVKVRPDGSTYQSKQETPQGIKDIPLVDKNELKTMPKGQCLLIVDGESAIVEMPQHWQHLPMLQKATFIRPSEAFDPIK